MIVGEFEDHVHVLCRLSKNLAVADLVRELKRESSKKAKESWLIRILRTSPEVVPASEFIETANKPDWSGERRDALRGAFLRTKGISFRPPIERRGGPCLLLAKRGPFASCHSPLF